MAETEIPVEGEITTWEAIPSELRWISTPGRLRQGIRELQMAWQCRENGHIKWRTIPLHIVGEDEFPA